MKKLITLFPLLLISLQAIVAQNVKNIKAKSLSADNVEITFDLESINSNEEAYKIEVYSSHNGFSLALEQVSGDVAKVVNPGKGKRIVWIASQELSKFEGNISFKIRATMVNAPWRVILPKTNAAIQKGKKNTIAWSGMSKGAETVSIEMKSKETGETISEHFSNTGIQRMDIPKNVKSGYYELKIANISGSGSATTIVKVKNKIPLVLKLSPLALLGAVGIYYFGTNSSVKTETINNSELPAPPTNP